jgi:hypothetical protein
VAGDAEVGLTVVRLGLLEGELAPPETDPDDHGGNQHHPDEQVPDGCTSTMRGREADFPR